MNQANQYLFAAMAGVVIGFCLNVLLVLPDVVLAIQTIAKGCGR